MATESTPNTVSAAAAAAAADHENGEEFKGPSKGELKKMAKKAQKVANKSAPPTSVPFTTTSTTQDAMKEDAIIPAADDGGTTIGTEIAGGWFLVAPDARQTATIKVVLAATALGVDLPVAPPLAAASTTPKTTTPSSHKTGMYLMYKTNSNNNNKPSYLSPPLIVAGGGNAMATAIFGAASHKLSSSSSSLGLLRATNQIDEWCEWERTVLRNPSPPSGPASTTTAYTPTPAVAAVWQHLEQALTSSGSRSSSSNQCSSYYHLVGDAITAADICVITTLFQQHAEAIQAGNVMPPALQRFVQAHKAAYETAVAIAQDLQKQHESASIMSSSDNRSGSGGTNSAMPDAVVDMNESSLLTVVDSVFRSVIAHVFGTTTLNDLPKHVVKSCSNPKHGDFQVSAAMPIFAALKATNNNPYAGPTPIAEAMIQAIGSNHPVVTDLTTQGPGFILCRLKASYLQHHVNDFLYHRSATLPTVPSSMRHKGQQQQTCVVDFSSPNIAKEMHVGHLRSTILGEAVCRILEAAGYMVHRVNHVGDWGTQFGMLIQYLREEYPAVVENNNDSELPNITDLTVFYKNAKQRFDDSPEFKKLSQTNVVQLQSGDAQCLKIWKMLCDVSRKEFQKVYNRLDVTCEEFGESYYNKKIPAVIEEFIQAKRIQIEEGGAKCVFVDKFKIPLMLQKSDGGYGYDSTDMAALKYRLQDLKADRIIVITDFTQGDHFKMVFQAGRDIGWLENSQQLQHIGFGTVQGEDGKRFKTRSGDTVRLVDLLDEAVHRMEAELKVRITEGKANISLDELHEVAEAIGYGAVKYYDLRRNPTSNYKFSYDQMLDTKGDTAVYLLYARVRLESIVAKAATAEYNNIVVDDLLKSGKQVEIVHESERSLALQLQQFADTMEQTLEDLYPFHICEYVYKLATAASDFVTQCRVLGSPEMESRLLLCHATTNAMRQCFDLLGIRHVKRI